MGASNRELLASLMMLLVSSGLGGWFGFWSKVTLNKVGKR
jgi:hypothetical protein